MFKKNILEIVRSGTLSVASVSPTAWWVLCICNTCAEKKTQRCLTPQLLTEKKQCYFSGFHPDKFMMRNMIHQEKKCKPMFSSGTSKRSQLPFFSRLLSILGYCTNMAVPDKGLVGEHLKGSFSKGDEKKVILNFRRLKSNENIITNVIVHFCQ